MQSISAFVDPIIWYFFVFIVCVLVNKESFLLITACARAETRHC
jgi:hypothetical protein